MVMAANDLSVSALGSWHGRIRIEADGKLEEGFLPRSFCSVGDAAYSRF
jgi:hypothetical protein